MHDARVMTDVAGAVEEIQAGRMVVVVDDEDRENEGDLTLAAEHVTPEAINFMARYGRGLICLTLTEERADYLRLGPMTAENSSRFGTAFTETIEAREGVTTGISAYDRAHTIKVAIDPRSTAQDLARPGHVFPLRARKGGVLVRAGQTEASVDLARMAGLIPAGVICEIMKDDGTMARVPDLIEFCNRARAEDADGGGADPVPAAERAVHCARGGEPDADGVGRVPHDCVRERGAWRGESHCAGARRCGAERKWGFCGACAGAGAFALPGGRCVWDDDVRLPAHHARVTEDDRGGWTGGAGLSAQREPGV